jgi:hypothetical protein
MTPYSTRLSMRRRPKGRRSLRSILEHAALQPVGVALHVFEWISDWSGSTQRLSHRSDRDFAGNLSDSLLFVFGQAGGRIEELPPSEYKDKRHFDDARAIVSATLLRLHFQKIRGQLEVQVASLKRPFEWQDVSTLLNWYDMKKGLPRREYPNLSDERLSEADDFLRANWTRLYEAVGAQEN